MMINSIESIEFNSNGALSARKKKCMQQNLKIVWFELELIFIFPFFKSLTLLFKLKGICLLLLAIIIKEVVI